MSEASILAHILMIKSRLYEIYEEITHKHDSPTIENLIKILQGKFHPHKKEVFDLETDYRYYVKQFEV